MTSPVTEAPASVGEPSCVPSSLPATRTSPNVTVSPGSASMEGARIVIPGSARNCLSPLRIIAYMLMPYRKIWCTDLEDRRFLWVRQDGAGELRSGGARATTTEG